MNADEADFRDIMRFDWLVTHRGDKLHAFAEGTYDDWNMIDGKFACGRGFGNAYIPGIFTRMAAPRCGRCCDVTSLPRGDGSPKNDDSCRPLVGLSA